MIGRASLLVALIALWGCEGAAAPPRLALPAPGPRDVGADAGGDPDPPVFCAGRPGSLCPLPNARGACLEEGCALIACAEGFSDCNGSVRDGCEIAITTDQNCGACRAPCPPESSCTVGRRGAVCARSVLCDEGRFDLDGRAENGCEWIERVEFIEPPPALDDARSIRALIPLQEGAFVALLAPERELASLIWHDPTRGTSQLELEEAAGMSVELLDARRLGGEGEERVEALVRLSGALSRASIAPSGSAVSPLDLGCAWPTPEVARFGPSASTLVLSGGELFAEVSACAPGASACRPEVLFSFTHFEYVRALSPLVAAAPIALFASELAACEACALATDSRRGGFTFPDRCGAPRCALDAPDPACAGCSSEATPNCPDWRPGPFALAGSRAVVGSARGVLALALERDPLGAPLWRGERVWRPASALTGAPTAIAASIGPSSSAAAWLDEAGALHLARFEGALDDLDALALAVSLRGARGEGGADTQVAVRAQDATAALWEGERFALAHPSGRVWRAYQRDVRTVGVGAGPEGFVRWVVDSGRLARRSYTSAP